MTNPNTQAEFLNAIVSAAQCGDTRELDNLETIISEWLIDELQREALENVLNMAREYMELI